MKQNFALNYDKNVFILREKLSQDLYLKTSIFNINNRRPKYGINPNLFMQYMYTVNSSSKGRNSPANKKSGNHSQTLTNSSSCTKSSDKNFKYKRILRSENLMSYREKFKAEQLKNLNLENKMFKNRINRVSSPYSRKKFRADAKRDEKISEMRRQVRSNNVIKTQEKYVQSKLPMIFIRNKK